MIDVVRPRFDHAPRLGALGARLGRVPVFEGPTMQSVRKAAPSSTSFHHRVSSPGLRAPDADSAASPANTPAALELHDRIEVWVNEGGAGGEANQ